MQSSDSTRQDALYDDERPGRPSELSEEQFLEFTEALQQPPEETRDDERAWTTALAQQYLIAEFDVAYSRRHVQRLMKKAEVYSKNPRPEPSSLFLIAILITPRLLDEVLCDTGCNGNLRVLALVCSDDQVDPEDDPPEPEDEAEETEDRPQ